MTSTKVGTLVALLDNAEQIFSVSVPQDSKWLLTDHKIFDVSRMAEIAHLGASTRIATFSVNKTTKIIVRGIDQPIVNLDYHGWPRIDAGTYAVFLMPPHAERSVLFAYTKLKTSEQNAS